MTRDEILSAIAEESTVYGAFVPSLVEIRNRMRRIVELSAEYPDHADSQYLAEYLEGALRRLSAMIELRL